MTTKVKKFTDGNITKYVWLKDDAVYESVLYRYPTFEQRMVLCISVQCGCPVGCSFCGTGKRFVRNLTSEEISDQVSMVCEDVGFNVNNSKKPQIMLMSMGEPFLNYKSVEHALGYMNVQYPRADLLVSTVAPRNDAGMKNFMSLSKMSDNIGLQFSIHDSTDDARDRLIPYKNKLSLWEIRNYGVQWWKETGRKPYLNYCVGDTNADLGDADRLMTLFPPNVFCFTFSVVCSPEKGKCGISDMENIEAFQRHFVSAGYDTRVFNPDGQDTIGGGCGQLWYVQDWMEKLETQIC